MTNNVGGMLEWGCIRYDGNQSLEYATMLSHWAVKKVKSRQRTQKMPRIISRGAKLGSNLNIISHDKLWYLLSSQIFREWKLLFSTKVTVYALCRGVLFIAPWLFEYCCDKAVWSLSVLQSSLFQLLRYDDNDHLTENVFLVWSIYC